MLRWVLGNLIRNAVRRTAAKATEEVVDASAPELIDREVALAVVSSRAAELCGLVDRLRGVITTAGAGFQVRLGYLAGKGVAAAAAEKQNAAQVTSSLILAHRPQLVVALGFATALVDDLSCGDLILGDSFSRGGEDSISIELAAKTDAEVHVGRLISTSTVSKKFAARRELAKKHGVLAADRVAYDVANACQELHVPMMAAHIVTMTVEDERPRDVDHLLRQESWAGRAGALLGGVVRRPSAASDLWQRQQTTWHASDRLADFVQQLLPTLPSRHPIRSPQESRTGDRGGPEQHGSAPGTPR